MRLASGIAALAAVGMSTSAVAQSATEAFECALPYRPAMESMGSLTVKEQSSVPENFLFGAKSIVEFETGDVKIFGHSPSALSLELMEPKKGDTSGDLTVSYRAVFPRSAALDTALVAAMGPMECESALGTCTGIPPILRTNGQLYFFRENERELLVVCRYMINEADLEE